MITESDQISNALNQASIIWPDLAGQRTLLLRKLIEIGASEVGEISTKIQAERTAQIQRLAGSLTGTWPENWREELKSDWPQ